MNSTHKLQSLYTNGKHDAIMCVWISMPKRCVLKKSEKVIIVMQSEPLRSVYPTHLVRIADAKCAVVRDSPSSSDIQKDRQTDIHTDRKTDIQTERQTETQTDRQTERSMDREKKKKPPGVQGMTGIQGVQGMTGIQGVTRG